MLLVIVKRWSESTHCWQVINDIGESLIFVHLGFYNIMSHMTAIFIMWSICHPFNNNGQHVSISFHHHGCQDSSKLDTCKAFQEAEWYILSIQQWDLESIVYTWCAFKFQFIFLRGFGVGLGVGAWLDHQIGECLYNFSTAHYMFFRSRSLGQQDLRLLLCHCCFQVCSTSSSLFEIRLGIASHVRATPKPASSMAHSTVTRALALWAHT